MANCKIVMLLRKVTSCESESSLFMCLRVFRSKMSNCIKLSRIASCKSLKFRHPGVLPAGVHEP